MSWHFLNDLSEVSTFSPESVGGSSVICFSATCPSALSKLIPCVETYSSLDSETERSLDFQSGMMYVHSTVRDGKTASISLRAASLAKTSRSPASDADLLESVAVFGSRCDALLEKSIPATSSSKMLKAFSPKALISSSKTWPHWGMMRGGEYSELIRSEPHTDETESGSWEPTPTSLMVLEKDDPKERIRVTSTGSLRKFSKTVSPEPGRSNEGSLNWPQTALYYGLVPTPTLCEQHMGFPVGWTDSARLAMPKFRRWLLSRGRLFLSMRQLSRGESMKKLTEKQEKNRQLVEGWLASGQSAEYANKVGKTGRQMSSLKWNLKKAGVDVEKNSAASSTSPVKQSDSRGARLAEALEQLEAAKKRVRVLLAEMMEEVGE